jgi:hypothetical protein
MSDSRIFTIVTNKSIFDKLDIKILLIIGVIVVLFFLFIYPMLSKKESFMDLLKNNIQNTYDNITNKLYTKQNMTDYTVDSECSKPKEKKVEFMNEEQHIQSDNNELPSQLEMPVMNIDGYNPYQSNNVEFMNEEQHIQSDNNELEMPVMNVDGYNPYQSNNVEFMNEEQHIHYDNNQLQPQQYVEYMSDIQSTKKMSADGNLEAPRTSKDIQSNKVDSQMCSKSCCSPQWGYEQNNDKRVMPNDLGTKFLATNYMCNGENPGDLGNGCVCVNKDTFGYLGNRAGNNME